MLILVTLECLAWRRSRFRRTSCSGTFRWPGHRARAWTSSSSCSSTPTSPRETNSFSSPEQAPCEFFIWINTVLYIQNRIIWNRSLCTNVSTVAFHMIHPVENHLSISIKTFSNVLDEKGTQLPKFWWARLGRTPKLCPTRRRIGKETSTCGL